MTYHFELANHPLKNGDYSIYLKLYHNGDRKRLLTSVTIPAKDWDSEKERVRKTNPSSKLHNEELTRLLDKARTVERELLYEDNLTMLRFLDRFQGREKHFKLLEYFNHIREVQESQKQWGNHKKYGDAMNKLSAYLKTLGFKDVDFRDVNTRFIDGYTKFLLTLPNKKDCTGTRTLSPNSMAKQLKILRAVLNRAILDGYLHSDDIPKKLVNIKETKPDISGLRDYELEKIACLSLEEGSEKWHARNCFFFAMYQAGVRIGDIVQLRWVNIVGDRLIHTMTKNGKKVDMVLLQEASMILKLYEKEDRRLKDYIFPYLDNNADYARYVTYDEKRTMPQELSKTLFNAVNSKEALIGKSLRQIADLAMIPRFTFHQARHTFALKAMDSGAGSSVIMSLLKHSSLDTTETYMNRLDNSKEDAAMRVMSIGHHSIEKQELVRKIQQLGISTEELIALLKG